MVEGELSPFEHESLYQILRTRFQLDHPSYVEPPDEDLATRINIVFHYPYSPDLFRTVFQHGWRELKELLKNVRHRRGRAGAAFNLTFSGSNPRIVFRIGSVDSEALGSALDQIGHLTSIIGQMVRPEAMNEPLGLVECSFDSVSDRWHDFKGVSLSDGNRVYQFNETGFKWVHLESLGLIRP